MSSNSKVRLDHFDPTIGFERGKSKFIFAIWYIMKICFFLNAFPFPSSFKCFILKKFGAKIGKGVVIKPRVNIHMPWKLEVGDHVWIGEEVFILNFERALIGNNVCISQRAFLCGGNHDFRKESMPYRNGKITLSDGVWIGAGVFVAPNTFIGIDTVVTAGGVVTGEVQGNAIFKGNPAAYVKARWSTS